MSANADRCEFLTVEEVAAICRVTPDTVYRWNYAHSGPPRVKLGRHVVYPVADFWAWIEARREA